MTEEAAYNENLSVLEKSALTGAGIFCTTTVALYGAIPLLALTKGDEVAINFMHSFNWTNSSFGLSSIEAGDALSIAIDMFIFAMIGAIAVAIYMANKQQTLTIEANQLKETGVELENFSADTRDNQIVIEGP